MSCRCFVFGLLSFFARAVFAVPRAPALPAPARRPTAAPSSLRHGLRGGSRRRTEEETNPARETQHRRRDDLGKVFDPQIIHLRPSWPAGPPCNGQAPLSRTTRWRQWPPRWPRRAAAAAARATARSLRKSPPRCRHACSQPAQGSLAPPEARLVRRCLGRSACKTVAILAQGLAQGSIQGSSLAGCLPLPFGSPLLVVPVGCLGCPVPPGCCFCFGLRGGRHPSVNCLGGPAS